VLLLRSALDMTTQPGAIREMPRDLPQSPPLQLRMTWTALPITSAGRFLPFGLAYAASVYWASSPLAVVELRLRRTVRRLTRARQAAAVRSRGVLRYALATVG
jgi:hypothetical protein